MGENPHEGHRERVKQRLLREGMDHFEDHQKLELLLFYGIPRRDTNELAHRLMDTFGGFSAVLDATYEELMGVKGMTHQAAVLLMAMRGAVCAYLKDRSAPGTQLTDTETVGRYLLPQFLGRRNETVILVCLDGRGRVINSSVIFEGSVNTTEISLRLILEKALLHHASAVILAHNHPNGFAIPSQADVQTTAHVVSRLADLNIQVLDHIVVAGEDFVSMRDSRSYASISQG